MTGSSLSIPDRVDAVVCGGGPAGSTFAALLSKKGHRVVLFERERFPRFHIGESLLPWNVPLLQRVGVLDKMLLDNARESRAQVFEDARVEEVLFYETSSYSGDGFCLIGDAACFLAPVFSTGVLMAMTSAELAVETVDHSLPSKGRIDARDFRRFERVYKRGVARFARFVHGFYERLLRRKRKDFRVNG
jgi:flavin-dependent dehydrogenase